LVPLVLTNLVTFLLTFPLLVMKVPFHEKNEARSSVTTATENESASNPFWQVQRPKPSGAKALQFSSGLRDG